jgi:hypothetical protein
MTAPASGPMTLPTGRTDVAEPIRIANCSGFFGDRPSGAREMVEGGPIDVLTGDWLAELTMLILSRIRAKQPGGGFARTFVAQMEEVMGTCLDRGIKVVSNAGGLDPAGCADAVSDIAGRLGLSPTIAFVDGDDLLPRLDELVNAGSLQPFLDGGDLGDPARYLTANAYLGCFGIVDALARGADIVITGRVTDAAVACGPAAWHHGWTPDDLDALAGGVVAGHLIECSAQVTGGNYSFFHEIDGFADVGGGARFGFPWADVAADGSCIIGKHDGTGGTVNVETVTSQLLYEISGPEYPGPDVTARFDSLALEQVGPDRVRVSGAVGQPPPSTLKVAMNELGGFRNSFSVALTGLDIDDKARFARAAFWDSCPYGPDDFESIDSRIVRTDSSDPATQEQATAIWRVTVKDRDERKVGRAVSDAMVHTVLAGIPGMYSPGGSPSAATPFGVYRPAKIAADLVPQYVHLLGGPTTVVERVEVSGGAGPDVTFSVAEASPPPHVAPDVAGDELVEVPLGAFVGTRSGDKGGDANLGVYARAEAGWMWLDRELTTERLRELLPETADLVIDRYRFPNLWAVNFVVRGLLQEGVAASTRQDPQAKALGEWLRSRLVTVPARVAPSAGHR